MLRGLAICGTAFWISGFCERVGCLDFGVFTIIAISDSGLRWNLFVGCKIFVTVR